MYKCFSTLPLRGEILEAVESMGFTEPTAIQEQAVPAMLEGRDIIGQAQTGTGKTAAFGIPLLQLVGCREKQVQALVLCPTRELAMQVCDELEKLGQYLQGLRILAVYGGQPIERQIQELKRGVQIVVGTPGRVKDHLGRGTLSLKSVRCLVLDEADEMLNMGFREEIEEIIEAVPDEAQRAFFSATMPESIHKLCGKYLKCPREIKISRPTMTVGSIKQSFYEIRPYRKLDALARILEWEKYNKALVFCSTRKMVDELTAFTQNKGLPADALHGELAQSQRDRVMGRYRSGELRVLIATDVAARGLDVDDVELVVNFDLPYDHESYVHRVGRTGRAGRSGRAVSIISGREYPRLLSIMRFTRAEIERARLPSLAELLDARLEILLSELKNELAGGKSLERFHSCLEQLENPNYKQIGAALLRMLLVGRMGEFEESLLDDSDEIHEIPHSRQPKRRFAELRSRYRHTVEADVMTPPPARGKREMSRPEPVVKHQRRPGDHNMVSLLFNAGKKSGLTPGDLVGILTNMGGISGKEIGKINLSHDWALVDVDRAHVEKIMRLMNKIQIRGRKLRVEVA
ncbi:MAG: DEAD/DEAH box helicase [Desulfovibrionaceae bacterium]|nr:DEAD/DEAH box helicase [Desulfovibrionaceae bacterium]